MSRLNGSLLTLIKEKKERKKKKQRMKKSIQVPNMLQRFTKRVETSMIALF